MTLFDNRRPMTPDQKHDSITQAWQAVPSAAAIITYLAGVPIEKWAAFAGFMFILVQMGYVVWKWRRDVLRERRREMLNQQPPDSDSARL